MGGGDMKVMTIKAITCPATRRREGLQLLWPGANSESWSCPTHAKPVRLLSASGDASHQTVVEGSRLFRQVSDGINSQTDEKGGSDETTLQICQRDQGSFNCHPPPVPASSSPPWALCREQEEEADETTTSDPGIMG